MTARNPFPIFDGHNDTLLQLHMPERGGGRDFFTESAQGHIDLPRARRGGFAGGFFAIFTPSPSQEQMMKENLVITENGYEMHPFPAIDPAYAQHWTIAIAARFFRLEAEARGQVRIVRSVDEIERCLETGVLAAVLHFERAEAIDGCASCAGRGAIKLAILKGAYIVFLFYSVHYPQPGKEDFWIQNMRQFDELIKKQPGIVFVSDIFKDPEKGALMGFTFWESEEAFQAAWPELVKNAPAGEWEVKRPDVYMFNSAD